MGKDLGRLPKYEPTEEDRDLVAILAGNGIPHAIIARCIKSPDTLEHIGLSTLKRHFKPQLKDGRAMSDATLIGRAYSMSAKNAAVLIFLCKTRLGWKEPTQEINLRQTYEELVRDASKKAEEHRKAAAAALVLVQGGKGS